MPEIKVLFAAAELAPLAKVGGLADVIGALPKSLIKHGVDVRMVIPKYGIINDQKYPSEKIAENINIPFGNKTEKVNIFKTNLPLSKVPVYLIDNYEYLGKNGVYNEKGDSSEECRRFTFFARSVIEMLEPINFIPNILHCHDWQLGLAPLFLKIKSKKDGGFKIIKSIITVHNLPYQGIYNYTEVLNLLNIKEAEAKLTGITKNNDNTINYLKEGIKHAHLVNTVSPKYAEEILSSEFGSGLEKILQERSRELSGILNGIDQEHFNPQTDKAIYKNYNLENVAPKKENKADLQKITGLKINPRIPLLGIVGRLAGQKGINLLETIAEPLINKPSQLVILGTGEEKLEKMIKRLAEKFPKKIFVKIAFDAKLAQKIYAGADIFLMPSRYEPCGLGQMIAMRYGTIPVVRATGGLYNTVKEYEEKDKTGTGFRFNNFSADGFLRAIEKSLKIYQNINEWQNLIKNAMAQDFSWDKSSKEYLSLYNRLLK